MIKWFSSGRSNFLPFGSPNVASFSVAAASKLTLFILILSNGLYYQEERKRKRMMSPVTDWAKAGHMASKLAPSAWKALMRFQRPVSQRDTLWGPAKWGYRPSFALMEMDLEKLCSYIMSGDRALLASRHPQFWLTDIPSHARWVAPSLQGSPD